MKIKLLYCFMLITTVNFGQTLDQDVPYTSNNGGFVFTSPSFELGQTFTAGITGDLSQINVWTYMDEDPLAPCNGAKNIVRLKIYSGEGNVGSILGYSDNVEIGAQSCTETNFPFTTPISITSGSKYTMIFEEVTNNCSQVVACRSDGGNPYTNGRSWHQTGGFYENDDVFFRTYVGNDALSIDNNMLFENDLFITNNHISIKIKDNVIYKIYDLTGKIIKKGTENEIDISSLNKGLYVIGVNNNIHKKFIKI